MRRTRLSTRPLARRRRQEKMGDRARRWPRSGVVADRKPEQLDQSGRLFAADDEPADVARLHADRAKNRTAHVRSSKPCARQIDTIEIAFGESRSGKVGGAEIGLLETTTLERDVAKAAGGERGVFEVGVDEADVVALDFEHFGSRATAVAEFYACELGFGPVDHGEIASFAKNVGPAEEIELGLA